MSTHLSDDLPRLLSGEATRDEVLTAAAHLRTCPDCQQELVSAVVAHASLTSAKRFAAELVTHREPVLPELGAVLTEARRETAQRRRRRLAAAAVAAVLVTGAGVTIAETVGSGSPAGRTVALAAFGVGTHPGSATIGATTMRIDATALPRLDARHFYEVWLTDPARSRLQAVGSIGNGNRAQLTVSPKVMSQYSAIEVSIQGLRQTAYSGTSVLRGSYG